MRTLNPTPLALLLCLIGAGCAQQSHEAAPVVGDFEMVGPTGDKLVGDDLEIEGIDLEPVPGIAGSCQVRIRLVAVYYGGTNIGPSWKLNGTVNGRAWSVGPRKLQYRKWNLVNEPVVDYVSKNCLPQLFLLRVHAQQVAKPSSNTGDASDITGTTCPPQGAVRCTTVPVIVEGTPWPKPLWGKSKAEMRLVFAISARCKTP